MTTLVVVSCLLITACSKNNNGVVEKKPEAIDFTAMGPATLSIVGLPEGAEVVTLSWFPGRDDDDPQGEIYEYSDGMTLPAGKLLFLIECNGYEALLASRIPVMGHTVLEAQMCKLDSGCHGSLKVKEQT
jgi:hypothetical protein